MTQQTKTCQNCTHQFIIEPEDFEFYDKIKVPTPTFCPECRMVRRMMWRNERALYRRKCDLCKNDIISIYSSNTNFPVYCSACWHSDKWDGLDFGLEYNFSESFFSQFKKLQGLVPRIALQVSNVVNSDFVNQVINCKNCYLITSSSDEEDSYYSHRLSNSKDIFDSFSIVKSEKCYESIECASSSNLIFTYNCFDSLDLSFCYDVRSSQNCFMSSNLRRASFIFKNQQYSKEDYKNKIVEIDTGSYKNTEKYKKTFNDLVKGSIRKYSDFKNAINFTGHGVNNSKDCFYCFNANNDENCRYCLFVDNAKDSFDVNNGCCSMELNYEVCTMGINASNIKFSVDAWPEVINFSYCDTCRNSSNLFACIGLRSKQYCILNKQYTKEEYEALVPKIIEHMNTMPYIDKKGREYKYGEFFPPELSPFAYNETIAQEYFPLTKEEAISKGYSWKEPEEKNYQITMKTEDIPDHIKDVPDSITNEIIQCAHSNYGGPTSIVGCNEQCTTAFKIIPRELEFYRKMNLPLPRLCPNCRHYQRIRQRNPLKLWKRKCMCGGVESQKLKVHKVGNEEEKETPVYTNTIQHFHGNDICPNEFETSYSPDRQEIVYCEKCYQQEVV